MRLFWLSLSIMRVVNSSLISKLWVKRGIVDVPSSLVSIKMRDGSDLVGLSKETTSGFAIDSVEAILTNKFLLVRRFLNVCQMTKECELVLWKEHQGTLRDEADKDCGPTDGRVGELPGVDGPTHGVEVPPYVPRPRSEENPCPRKDCQTCLLHDECLTISQI